MNIYRVCTNILTDTPKIITIPVDKETKKIWYVTPTLDTYYSQRIHKNDPAYFTDPNECIAAEIILAQDAADKANQLLGLVMELTPDT